MAAPTIAKYPEGTPFETGMLEVSKSPPHIIYYEVSGNKDGNPVVFLHGGPGGGTSPTDRTYFNPEKYKIVLFDQRGCGKSQPTSSLEANTTWDLVADIEKIREKLKIDRWVVFGGSWGSTLSLAYAQTHPDRVKGLILRGIFTLRKSELDFFYQNGTSHLFPDAWEEYVAPVPEAERGDFVKAYHKLLNSDDEKVRLNAARAWSKWEMSTSRLYVDPEYIARAAEDDWANFYISSAFARIENHYFINEGFMRQGQLLEKQSIDKMYVLPTIHLKHITDVARSRDIPTIVVQGRYDVVCPMTTAWALKQEWPDIELHIVPSAGHSAREPDTANLLTEAADKFASL
ncbi:Proline iminopeptidase [Ceratobasidium theobromae]|uniref:Proline iminopeptidase n=1 Tax=Ceratobasidium theobromae TaxID=1582974 RepID=A0A5N5QQG4_9AGAM|nr:Proline iminopeptidase [Ceratobasidium theobromae]